MAGFVVWVEFRLKNGAFDRFHALVRDNAAASVRDEAGCRQFDVLLPEGGGGATVALYEIYDDEAAFETHLGMPHFKSFDAACADLVESREVRRFHLS